MLFHQEGDEESQITHDVPSVSRQKQASNLLERRKAYSSYKARRIWQEIRLGISVTSPSTVHGKEGNECIRGLTSQGLCNFAYWKLDIGGLTLCFRYQLLKIQQS